MAYTRKSLVRIRKRSAGETEMAIKTIRERGDSTQIWAVERVENLCLEVLVQVGREAKQVDMVIEIETKMICLRDNHAFGTITLRIKLKYTSVKLNSK